MVTIPRETICSAIFTRMQSIPGLVSVSRKLKHWADTGSVEQPALFMGKPVGKIERKKGRPKRINLTVDLYLYCPLDRLNTLLDAIEEAFEPEPGADALTLGIEDVSHCWISDNIETDEGVLGEQAVAIIPLHTLFFSTGTVSEIVGLIDEDTGATLTDEDTGQILTGEAPT